jgi:hypothetical protein
MTRCYLPLYIQILCFAWRHEVVEHGPQMNICVYSHCCICDVDLIKCLESCAVAQELPGKEIWLCRAKDCFVVQTNTVIMV